MSGQRDLRGLAPPEPMEIILQWLDAASAGEQAQFHLPHTPFPLYEHLRLRRCHWECAAQSDGSAILTVFRD
ncbi:DUF2249 domain-containing protein [Chitinibacter sp. SCUT-21]|uniref:DUF2249 domain-containing protein n=1 Tax=Chitinibacter sp. SCUT-21 TaxID=2970891 RepID=UPI0035A6D2E7